MTLRHIPADIHQDSMHVWHACLRYEVLASHTGVCIAFSVQLITIRQCAYVWVNPLPFIKRKCNQNESMIVASNNITQSNSVIPVEGHLLLPYDAAPQAQSRPRRMTSWTT